MKFENNRSTHIYHLIICKARTCERSKTQGIFERHHIIPRSLGGSDNYNNLVLLTPKEHYVCHRLLTKMVTGKARSKMYAALMFLQNSHEHLRLGYYSSRKYEVDRIAARVTGPDHQCYGREVSQKQIERMRSLTGDKALFFGKKHTDESKKKMSLARVGRQTGADNPMFGKEVPEERRRRIAEKLKGKLNHAFGVGCVKPDGTRYAGASHGMYGKKHSEETRAKIRVSVAGKQKGALNHRFGVTPSEEQRLQHKQAMTGRTWMNNGTEQRFVTPQDFSALLADGWTKGRKPK